MLVRGLLVLLLPETLNEDLPETIVEAEKLGWQYSPDAHDIIIYTFRLLHNLTTVHGFLIGTLPAFLWTS